MYLAFNKIDKGNTLQKNTVASYFGQVKQWLLETQCTLRNVTARELNKMGHVVEKYCKKRESSNGVFEKKAPACTKNDLLLVVQTIYAHATGSVDYSNDAPARHVAPLWSELRHISA